MPASLPSIQMSGLADRMDTYSAAIRAAGGRPVPAYAPFPDLSCAGLLLCGGEDIEPWRFGQEDRGSEAADILRDERELALFQAFFRAGKPILGICRGMQVINVALGGDLIQDLPAEHRPFHRKSGVDLIHPIVTAEGSLFRQLLGPLPQVNSSHHQGLGRLGDGLVAEGWSEGGVIEAMTHRSQPILGVQFHPERMSFALQRPDAVDCAPIFHHFISLCRG